MSDSCTQIGFQELSCGLCSLVRIVTSVSTRSASTHRPGALGGPFLSRLYERGIGESMTLSSGDLKVKMGTQVQTCKYKVLKFGTIL